MTFLQRPSTRSLILWIILIRSVVFLTFWFLELNYGFRPTERIGFFFYGNDAHSYLDPIETFVDHGAFLLDGEYSAFRMPGYLLLYWDSIFYIWTGNRSVDTFPIQSHNRCGLLCIAFQVARKNCKTRLELSNPNWIFNLPTNCLIRISRNAGSSSIILSHRNCLLCN